MTANRVPSGLRLMRNTPSWTWQIQECVWVVVVFVNEQMSVLSTEGMSFKSGLSPFHLRVWKTI